MTVRWKDILGQLARSTTMVGNFTNKFLRAIMFLTCRQFALVNSWFLSQNKFLRDQKSFISVTEEIWLNYMRFPMASLEGIGRCMILSWASLGNFSLVFRRPPLTVRCFLWLKKGRWNYENKSLHASCSSNEYQVFKVTPISSLSKSSEIQSLQSKIFIFRGRLSL